MAKVRKKSTGRDGNWRNFKNWHIVCSHCGAEFNDAESIDVTGESGHYAEEHPGEPVAFSTVWVGKGPRPRRTPWG